MKNGFNQKLNDSSGFLLNRVITRLRRRSAFYQFEKLRQLPMKPLSEAFQGIEKTRCTIEYGSAIKAVLGNVDANELISISALCAYLSPEAIFEFGTFDGRTTLHLALNSPAAAHIITLDLDPHDPLRKSTSDDTFYTYNVVVGNHFQGTGCEQKIKQIYTDTTKYNHSAMKGKVDMIFIDAGHTYELVKSDSQKALDMVRAGGVILWHDYSSGHPGVYTCLHELSQSISLFNIMGTSLVCHIQE